MKLEEVAPGIHRIESDIGPGFVAQHLLVGEDRVVIVDTRLATTPEEALLPGLEQVGAAPDLIVISHADRDHCGGNRRVREAHPRATFACQELDRRGSSRMPRRSPRTTRGTSPPASTSRTLKDGGRCSRSSVATPRSTSDGINDRAGTKLIPPRYYDAAAECATEIAAGIRSHLASW